MANRQKILFLSATSTKIAGGEKSNLELIKAARKYNFEPVVVLPGKGDIQQDLRRQRISHTIVPYYWWKWGISKGIEDAGLINIMAIGRISKFISKRKIVCVISNTLNVPWGAWVSALHNLPHVWVAREFPDFGDFSYLEARLDFVERYSNMICANSSELARHLREYVKGTQIKHFYSFVDVGDIKINKSINKARLIVVGDICQRKNQLELIEAYNLLPKKIRLKTDILLIGEISDKLYAKKINDKFKSKGYVNNKLTFKGKVKNPYNLIGPNDIMVQTSLSESLGRYMTECMKLGLICIGADIKGTKEAFRMGGGSIYRSGDIVSLSNVLRRVLRDNSSFKTSALKYQSRALINLSEKSTTGLFFKNIEEVLGQDNPKKEIGHFKDYFENSANIADQHIKQLIKNDEEINSLISKKYFIDYSIKDILKIFIKR